MRAAIGEACETRRQYGAEAFSDNVASQPFAELVGRKSNMHIIHIVGYENGLREFGGAGTIDFYNAAKEAAMGLEELIQKVRAESGFSDAESHAALHTLVEAIAERLPPGDREIFAKQLPAELNVIALSALPITDTRQRNNVLLEFMEKEHVEADHALKQLYSSWSALKTAISEGKIRQLKARLPDSIASLLY